MTSPDHLLDPNLILAPESLTLYRLARTRYANLSGLGAALATGRWNRSGEEAIYTPIEQSTPLLERLAHTAKSTIPSNLSMMKIRLSGSWKKSTTGGPAVIAISSLREAEHAFSSESYPFAPGTHPLAVAVPSVIVPVWNVILFPQANAFWDHVSLESIEPFDFDPRLFPDQTPKES